MRRRTPKECTVLIARTGEVPVTLSIKPIPALIALAIALAIPAGWLGFVIYSLRQENEALTERNDHLSKAANEVVKDLEVLDAEIEVLRERAGIPDRQLNPSEGSALKPQGGVSVQLAPEALFEVARRRLPALSSRFNHQVKPALTETLEEEAARDAARPKGKPVKAFLRISSEFGLRPNPFGRGYELHNGIDFPGPIGTPIHATASGTVEKAEWSRGYGYHVVINHGYGYRTLYAHLSKLAIAAGTPVQPETVIGYLGNTGRSTGPHLHYSVFRDGEAVDPAAYLSE